MNDKTIELLRELAAKLGFEAARVWPQIVMVTWIQAIFWTVADVLMIAACLAGLIAASRLFRKREQFNDPEFALLASAMVFVMSGFGLIVAVSSLSHALPAIFYPEAQTVLYLIGKGG